MTLIERLEAAGGPDRELDEIERLLAAATPGRWCLQTGALGVNPWISGPNWTRPDGSYVRGGCILNMVAHDEREHDAALIVAARNSLPAMIAAIRDLEAENARLREALTSEREENLWNAYGTGIVRDGKWDHLCMSGGEWLADQCGFDRKTRRYSDQAIRDAIPIAARQALADMEQANAD